MILFVIVVIAIVVIVLPCHAMSLHALHCIYRAILFQCETFLQQYCCSALIILSKHLYTFTMFCPLFLHFTSFCITFICLKSFVIKNKQEDYVIKNEAGRAEGISLHFMHSLING